MKKNDNLFLKKRLFSHKRGDSITSFGDFFQIFILCKILINNEILKIQNI